MDTAPDSPVVDLPPPPDQAGGSESSSGVPPSVGWGRPPHGVTDVIYPMPQREKSGKGPFMFGCLTGCFLAVVIPVAVFIFFIVVGISSLRRNMGSDAFKEKFGSSLGVSAGDGEYDAGSDDFPSFNEIWSCGDNTDDSAKIVRIPLEGVIMLEEGRWGVKSGSALMALQSIQRATLDKDVRGIIMEIDSPGGGVTASDIIWNALQEFKASDTNRAVVAMMGDTCASGGYYVAAAADAIVAHPTTLTGSIGVIFESLNIRELADKIGVKDVSISSGDNKQMLSPFHDLTDEQRKMLQDSVDKLNGRFIDIVAEGRELSRDKVAEIADGRIFIAEEALRHDLVDLIGYFPDALDEMAELIGTDSLHVVRYERKSSLMDLLGGEGFFGMSTGLRLLEEVSRTRLMYKWRQ